MKNQITNYMVRLSFVIAILASILLGGSFYFIYGTKEDIALLNDNFLNEITKQNASYIKNTVELNLDKLDALSNVIGSHETVTLESTMEILKLETKRSSFKRMGYADKEGNAYTTDGSQFNIENRSYFRQAIKGEKSVSDRLEDRIGGGYINVYAVPFYHQGEIVGIIFETSTNENFTELLSTDTFDGAGFSYIVNRDGTLIAYSEKKEDATSNLYRLFEQNDEIGNIEKNVSLLDYGIKKEDHGFISFTWEGMEHVGAYHKVDNRGWYSVTLVPKTAITTNSNRIIIRNIAIVILTSSIFIILIGLIGLQNRKRKKDLEHIAYIDDLTGALNFKAFKKEAQEILLEGKEHTYIFVKFDVENFKFINDRLGFELGDSVLQNIADGLHEVVEKGSEVFARIDADEFIIMLKNKNEHLLAEVRGAFVDMFNQYMGPDFNHFIRFHSGLYILEDHETDIDTIYEKVNYAHRQAKLLSVETDIVEFYYNDEVKKEAMKKIRIEERMAEALKNEEFQIYIQPKYCLHKEVISGGEALVRWIQEDGTLHNPNSFIPIFEQNGFIVKLDMYMFEHVCKLVKKWMQEDAPIVSISVNFSKLHLYNSHFIEELVRITEFYQVPRKYLEIELTETIFFENESLIETVLMEAHEAGFIISMDDFGSGYSSLGLLRNITVDVIKMDRSFFVDIKHEERTKVVVEYVMKMARKLGIKTLAEGIETQGRIDMLKDFGCDYVQGYYYAKPMPVEIFEEMLIKNHER